jgi:hypothetical protein
MIFKMQCSESFVQGQVTLTGSHLRNGLTATCDASNVMGNTKKVVKTCMTRYHYDGDLDVMRLTRAIAAVIVL